MIKKKLNSTLYVILILITAFCTTSCGKDDGGNNDGNAILLDDLFGFWQSGNDSFTFQKQDEQLGGSGTVGGKTGTVKNGKINGTKLTFDLVDDGDNSVKSYTGTIDKTKKILKLTTSGVTATFNKQ